jgi:hypothetical protein
MNPAAKPSKKLNVWLYILRHPEGVSEKPLNRAVKVMSGRNYLTELEREHGVLLTSKRLRQTASDGSRYTVYQLRNKTEAHKLLNLALALGKQHGVNLSAAELEAFADKFPHRQNS